MRAFAAGVAFLSVVVAGCGAGTGEPDRIGQTSSYDAAIVARQALDDAALDPESIAYGKSLLVAQIHASTASDGSPAWRVGFENARAEPSVICVWVWEDPESRLEPSYLFEVGRCPVDDAA